MIEVISLLKITESLCKVYVDLGDILCEAKQSFPRLDILIDLKPDNSFSSHSDQRVGFVKRALL